MAIYGEGGKRWAMTERGRHALRRSADWLAIGPSSLSWDGTSLTIRLDEVTAPIPSRLRGMVRVTPHALVDRTIALDGAGRHRWSPIGASARIEAFLYPPALNWSGDGYFDMNSGDEPLEQGFQSWTWSRAPLKGGTAILYDATRRDGSELSVALLAERSGAVRDFEAPVRASLPRTFWGLPRETRADRGFDPGIVQSLEDAPFYSRSVLSTSLLGEPVRAVHESLSLDRFIAPWTQFCLPFRMPRGLI